MHHRILARVALVSRLKSGLGYANEGGVTEGESEREKEIQRDRDREEKRKKKGRNKGMKEGRKERRKEGRKEGRKERRKEEMSFSLVYNYRVKKRASTMLRKDRGVRPFEH